MNKKLSRLPIREIFNIITGALGFCTWFYLSKITPEYSIQIAIATLSMLVGFGGRDTIKDIIKTINKEDSLWWKN